MLLHQVWQKSLFARLNLINTQPLIGPNMFLALFDWQSGLIHLVGSHHTVGLLFCSSLSLHLHVPPTGGWERWKWCGWKTAASEEAERWSRWQKESRTGGGREEAQQPKERYLPFFTTFPKHTTLLPSVSAVQTPIPSCFVINICWSNFFVCSICHEQNTLQNLDKAVVGWFCCLFCFCFGLIDIIWYCPAG